MNMTDTRRVCPNCGKMVALHAKTTSLKHSYNPLLRRRQFSRRHNPPGRNSRST